MARPDPPFDVAIVGCGPVGATLALLLGRRGLRVVVLESAVAIYDKPRAITADHEAMRVFQECGVADAIARGTIPHPGTDYLGLRGQVIKRFYPQPPPQPLAWEPSWMFVQPDLEAILRDALRQQTTVALWEGHELLGFAESPARVQLQVRRAADGAALSLSCRYLVGCDGGRSLVRRELASTIEDLAFDEWWMIIDARIRGQVSLPPRAVQYCRPERPGTYMVGPGSLRRWEIKLLPGETPDDFADEAAVRRVWSRFVDVDAFDLWRTAIYRFHALVVERWNTERVFLMGDAAHQMPPFLGQGLCAGVRDASNLAWKLAGVLEGRYDTRVLHTYGPERKPHVRTIVGHAKSFGMIIGELDPVAAANRDARLEAELLSGKAETVRQKFIPGLSGGLIDLDAQQQPQPGAGALFPQPWVRSGDGRERRLDDVCAPGFLLVGDVDGLASWLDPQAGTLWAQLRGSLVEIRSAPLGSATSGALHVQERDGVFASWLAAHRARVALVRPDHYVYGCAADPAGLGALVRRLAHALFPSPAAHAPAVRGGEHPATGLERLSR